MSSIPTIEISDFRLSPRIDQVGIEERVRRFQSRSIKTESKIQGLKLVLSMIDLTTLEGKDTPGKVKQLCYKARHLHDSMPGLPSVAAVCVYPTFVKMAKKETVKVTLVKSLNRRLESHKQCAHGLGSRKINQMKSDIVIFSYWHPFFSLMYSYIAKKIKTKKIYFLIHNAKPHQNFPFQKFLIKYMLQNATHLVKFALLGYGI